MSKVNLFELTRQQMKIVKAGQEPDPGDWAWWDWNDSMGIFICGCGCYYADTGGSSSDDNGDANWISGACSPKVDPTKPTIPLR